MQLFNCMTIYIWMPGCIGVQYNEGKIVAKI